MSQKADILAALTRFGCLRLAARICELKQEGWGIVSGDFYSPNGKTVAAYRLPRLELF